MAAQRRRRQADLDDRARLEHAEHGAAAPATPACGRGRSRSASARRSRPSSSRRPTAASPPTRTSQVALWFGLQDIPGSKYAGGYGLYRADGSPKPLRRRVPARSPRGIAPLPCGGVIDKSGPDIQVAQPLDGAKFVDVIADRRARGRLARRRRHPRGSRSGPTASSSARSATATRRCAASGRLALLEARQAHADVQGRGRGRQHVVEDDHRLQGAQAAEGQDRGDARRSSSSTRSRSG